MVLLKILVCNERFATRGSLRRHNEQKKRSCMEKPVGTRCMFCGYGLSGEEFENRWRLSEHALGKLCHSIMQFQWSSTDHQQVRARGQLMLPTEKNVMKLVTERHLNSFSRLLERDSNRHGWMPTLDQVNKTLIANEKATLDSLPAVRETEDGRRKIPCPFCRPRGPSSIRFHCCHPTSDSHWRSADSCRYLQLSNHCQK